MSGNLDIQARVLPGAFDPQSNCAAGSVCTTVMAKWSTASIAAHSWTFGFDKNGALGFHWGNGTATQFTGDNSGTLFSTGVNKWIRVTLQNSNGANSIVSFYSSADGVSWSLLSSRSATAMTACSTCTADVSVGALTTASLTGSDYFAGRIYRAVLRSGIQNTPGSPVTNADTTSTVRSLFDPREIVNSAGSSAPGVDTTYADSGTVTWGSGNQLDGGRNLGYASQSRRDVQSANIVADLGLETQLVYRLEAPQGSECIGFRQCCPIQ